jgi:tRNA U34 2-thiouridine synthase MnmA/TrmU
MSRDQLRRARFPVGHLQKPQVRSLARDFGLPNQARKDSQGICFLGKIRYPGFIRFHLGEREGPIVNLVTGDEIGRHDGYWLYTIGQRQGLGMPAPRTPEAIPFTSSTRRTGRKPPPASLPSPVPTGSTTLRFRIPRSS